MLKFIGLLIIFLTSLFTGIYFWDKNRTVLMRYISTQKMLMEIKNMLRFNQPNKIKLYDRLRKSGFGDCLDNYQQNPILKEYLDKFGTHDLNSEIELITQSIEQHQEVLKEIKKDLNDRCKLAIGGSILIGTFLVVMLI